MAFHCYKCGSDFISYRAGDASGPDHCPKCLSKTWDIPRDFKRKSPEYYRGAVIGSTSIIPKYWNEERKRSRR